MNVKNQIIDYKPSFVSGMAKIIIPILKALLPTNQFHWVYNKLYQLNMRRIWLFYSIRSHLNYLFVSKEIRQKNVLIRKILPYTLGGWKALDNAFNVVAHVEKNKIPGVIIECGVAQGGSAAMMALSSRALGNEKRDFWFFDSYEGLPEPTAEDYEGTKAGDYVGVLVKGSCLGTIEQVSELLFDKLNLPKHKINLVKGWFQDTVPLHKEKVGKIAILRLDGDWYESTKIPLENFYSFISPGGCVIIDDYATCFGSKKATDEFIEKNSIDTYLRPDYRGGAWFVKPL
jgi:O-methyltransferase